MDAIRGNAALFMRRDEVEAAWRFIDPDPRGVGGDARSRRGPTPPAPGDPTPPSR